MENEKDILRWLDKEMSSAELDKFKRSNDYKKYHEIAEASKSLTYPSVDPEKALEDFKNRLSKHDIKSSTPFYKKKIFNIAASIILILGISFIFFNNNQNQLNTLAGQTKSLELKDNTLVKINAGSELTFNENKFLENRNLNLDGEAFFDVRKKGAFKVNTSYGEISVLGTSFNIKSRQNDFQVFCFTGKVEVKVNTEIFELVKGEGVRKNKNGVFEKFKDQTLLKPHWLNNESVFYEVPYKEVISEFERQYDLKIKVKGLNEELIFTGAFSNQNLNSAIKSITLPLNLKYQKDGNVITISK